MDEEKPNLRVLEQPDSGAAECLEEMLGYADSVQAIMIVGITKDGRPFIRTNRMTDGDKYYIHGFLNAYAAQTMRLFDDGDDAA